MAEWGIEPTVGSPRFQSKSQAVTPTWPITTAYSECQPKQEKKRSYIWYHFSKVT